MSNVHRTVLAVRKGGIGKTTLTANIAAALAEKGRTVLVVDADPQQNLTMLLGCEVEDPEQPVLANLLAQKPPSLADVVVETQVEGISLVPTGPWRLEEVAQELVGRMDGYVAMRNALDQGDTRGRYDYVLIDSPPGFGRLTTNAIAASDQVIGVITRELWSIKGISDLKAFTEDVHRYQNGTAKYAGAVYNMFQPRLEASEAAEQLIRETGLEVFATRVPHREDFVKSVYAFLPLVSADPRNPAAQIIRTLAEEVFELPTTEPVDLRVAAAVNPR